MTFYKKFTKTAGDLLEVRYSYASSEKYTYDEKGNCLSYKDRDGIITEFAYNSTGRCSHLPDRVKDKAVDFITVSCIMQ